MIWISLRSRGQEPLVALHVLVLDTGLLRAVNAAIVSFDIVETRDGIEVTTDLPGLKEKDVEVTVADNVLTIEGERQIEVKTAS